jgi:hypothetical protein
MVFWGGAVKVSCTRCGATLCEYSLGTIVVRHQKRLFITTIEGVQALQCGRCGAVFDGDRVREMIANNRGANGQETTEERPTS